MIIYQLYYKEEQIENCFEESQLVKCPNLDKKAIWIDRKYPLFENHEIIALSMGMYDNQYYGILSHAFKKKVTFINSYKDLQLKVASKADAEVITFHKKHDASKFMPNMERWHPGSLKLINDTLELAGLPVAPIKTTVYSNYFIAKGSIIKDYVNTWLIPFVQAVYEMPERYYVPANYKKAIKEKGCDYPLHPFIIERLFSVYLANNNYKIYEN